MATCILVASGPDFAVDEYFQMSPFRPHSVFRQPPLSPGIEARSPGRDPGFSVVVGEDQEPSLKYQAGHALEFLIRHEQELIRLKGFGADTLLLDFGVTQCGGPEQSHSVPPELIQTLARFRMGLILSTVTLPGRSGAEPPAVDSAAATTPSS